MMKPKEYDWKDSNLAMFGSDEEHKVKLEAAEQEPAWSGLREIQKDFLKIWRIEKFKVEDWKETYGKFYQGDSYIILKITKNPETEILDYHVHFWIGKESTQDEYGTAAYKTVELDLYLGDKPVQHREVQNKESELFKSYFQKLEYLKGGISSGFRHVTTEEYQPRLLQFNVDRKIITLTEVTPTRQNLDESDVFIFDSGSRVIQWNGKSCNKDEKFKAMQHMNKLKSERPKAEYEIIDCSCDDDLNHFFYKSLNNDPKDIKESKEEFEKRPKSLYRVSDASGQLKIMKLDSMSHSNITNDDVYILDTGDKVMVYIGEECSEAEKRNGFGYAMKLLVDIPDKLCPISVMHVETPEFRSCFDD